MKFRTLLALLLPLGAIADDARIAYRCDNGSRLDISFLADISGRPQARLHFADEVVSLPQVPAASGALYRSGDIRLHTRDHEAILEDGKGNRRHCTRGDTPPAAQPTAQPEAQPAVSSFIELSGSVTYPSRIALPPGAILTIRIQSAGRLLVEQRYELNGAQVPIPFSATVDRDLIGKKARLTVAARIDAGGKRRLVGEKSWPARQNGQAMPVDITLRPVALPSR